MKSRGSHWTGLWLRFITLPVQDSQRWSSISDSSLCLCWHPTGSGLQYTILGWLNIHHKDTLKGSLHSGPKFQLSPIQCLCILSLCIWSYYYTSSPNQCSYHPSYRPMAIRWDVLIFTSPSWSSDAGLHVENAHGWWLYIDSKSTHVYMLLLTGCFAFGTVCNHWTTFSLRPPSCQVLLLAIGCLIFVCSHSLLHVNVLELSSLGHLNLLILTHFMLACGGQWPL
jgi:hypothetical protein